MDEKKKLEEQILAEMKECADMLKNKEWNRN